MKFFSGASAGWIFLWCIWLTNATQSSSPKTAAAIQSEVNHIIEICSATRVNDQFVCGGGECIHITRICDEVKDCPDGTDEDKLFCQRLHCPKGFVCGSGECISRELVCDGSVQCFDDSDENHCANVCPKGSFRCTDGRCISEDWVCDGEFDCMDHSDEPKNCSEKGSCNKKNEKFLCDNGLCITNYDVCDGVVNCGAGEDEEEGGLSNCGDVHGDCNPSRGDFRCLNSNQCFQRQKLCDYHKDCADGSDEKISGISKCNETCSETTCDHGCHISPEGPKCFCNDGYEFSTDKKRCQDINECDKKKTYCDHFCSNTEGNFTCSCAEGYNPDGLSCKSTSEASAILIYSVGRRVQAKYLKTDRQVMVYEGHEMISGVAYDPYKQQVYWIEGKNKIKRKKINGYLKAETFVDKGLQRPDNIALDWLGRNLYIVDSNQKKIIACALDTNECIPVLTNVTKPRAIQLDLENRYMYWTDLRENSLFKAGLDGSDKKNITGNGHSWPNGLALDHPAGRLYWMDDDHKTMESCDLDGKNIKATHFSKHSDPSSIAIWEDRLYWSDDPHNDNQHTRKQIESCRKRDGKDNIVEHRSPHAISNLVIYHESMFEKAKNPCRYVNQLGGTGPCSHICLLSPKLYKGFECMCPVEMELVGRYECKEINRAQPLIAVENDFYLLKTRDLGKYSSSSLSLNYLDLNEGNQKIVGMDYDYRTGLVYAADAKNKRIIKINMETRQVSSVIENVNPFAVAVDWVRNNLYWVNERHGHNVVEVMTLDGKYRRMIIERLFNLFDIALDLKAGHLYALDNTLLSNIQRCNLDGQNCTKIAHNEERSTSMFVDYQATKTHVYWTSQVKRKGTIESILPDGTGREIVLETLEDPYKIIVNDQYVMWTRLRSKQLHMKPLNITKPSQTFDLDIAMPSYGAWFMAIALVGGPVPSNVSMDICTQSNCEQFCFTKTSNKPICSCAQDMELTKDGKTCQISPCEKDKFVCRDQSCVYSAFVCDGSKDCDDGSDEDPETCYTRECGDDEFKCNNGECISLKDKCDEIDHCNDKSDELPSMCAEMKCKAHNEFKCTSGECIPLGWRCDTTINCKDNSDEDPEMCKTYPCPENKLRCNDGSCIHERWWCDTEKDCKDGEDEEDCPCADGEIRCTDGICKQQCDQVENCIDKDRKNCKTSESLEKECPINYKECKTGMEENSHEHTDGEKIECIPISGWCNGTKECIGGEDELVCHSTIELCLEGEERCADGIACVPKTFFCNGVQDCLDDSDESIERCPKNKTVATTVVGGCEEDQFECRDGTCIEGYQVCNGKDDCFHREDETKNCDRCANDNGGCEHYCKAGPNGVECSCYNGFKLNVDERSCSNINECTNQWDICDQLCRDLIGDYRCECAPGYDRDRAGTCKPDNGELWKLAVYYDDSISINEVGKYDLKKIRDIPLKSIIPSELFYNPRGENILIVDGMKGNVYSMDDEIDEKPDGKPVLIFEGFGPIISSALDYVNNNFYISVVRKELYSTSPTFTLTELYICNLSLRKCGFLVEISKKIVAAMSISNKFSKLYYCDNDKSLASINGKISSRTLDGSGELMLTDKVRMCNSMAIDEIQRRIYWTDERMNIIQTIDILGKDQKAFLSKDIHYPSGLVLVDHSLVWINRDLNSLVKCRRRDHNDCYDKSYSNSPIIITDIQPVVNITGSSPCQNFENCEEGICAPHTHNTPRCICTVGYKRENKTCVPVYKLDKPKEIVGSCAASPCHAGTCIDEDEPGKISCKCNEGYLGRYCQVIAKQIEPKKHTGLIVGLFILFIIVTIVAGVFFYVKRNGVKIFDSPERSFHFVRNPNFGFMKNGFMRNDGLLQNEYVNEERTPLDERFDGRNGNSMYPGLEDVDSNNDCAIECEEPIKIPDNYEENVDLLKHMAQDDFGLTSAANGGAVNTDSGFVRFHTNR